ncbi:MAG TPA: hypothetical protein VKB16_06770 [Beijerinckiaceae bacterium]|nr:hypothetical protein [Beijerinckiaceae bacterium]
MSSGTEATDRKMRDWIELTLDSNRPVWVNLGQASSICWVPEDSKTVIAFVGAKDDVVSVRETPEQILARSKT